MGVSFKSEIIKSLDSCTALQWNAIGNIITNTELQANELKVVQKHQGKKKSFSY